MVDREGARTIVGIIGNVISFGLFLSPIPKFIKIWKQKAVEEFKPDPYLATVLNCMMWTFYGMPFVQPDSILVITINGIGLATEAIYVFIFFLYSPWQKRRNIMFALVVELVFMTVVIFITLYFFHTHKNRARIVGILCTVYNVIMYTSSLAIACRVIKTRSVKYLPFPLSLADLCNGICWAIYALLKLDPYILIINGLGTLSGLAQLILHACYYKSTNWDDEDGKPEVQISNWDDDDGKPEVQNSNDKIVVELLISHILC